MTAKEKSIEERIDQLHADGVIDLHFDLPMDLYEKRKRNNVLKTEFLPELEAGNIGAVGVAIYIEDRYLPETGLHVALDQAASEISRVGMIAQIGNEMRSCKFCRKFFSR